jgi:hypothetical protein
MSVLCCQYLSWKKFRQGETLATKVRRHRSGAGEATRVFTQTSDIDRLGLQSVSDDV